MAKLDIDHSILSDDYIVYIENEHIKLGVNLGLGGAVTYLAEHGKKNLINSYDWGRQVQMSFYSHPVPFCPEGHDMAQHWYGIGWNPIQSGDCYGHRSRVLEHRCEKGEIYVKCIPMHWPLDNYPGECTFEVWYRLCGYRVEVTARLNNARPDTTQYPARGTELPAVYTNGEWYKLVSYIGNAPFTGEEPQALCTKENELGWPWIGYRATEFWTALVDDDHYGLGVYNDASTRWVGGFFGEKGVGGPKDYATGYICPEILEVLDYNIVYTYQYALILGSLEDIRNEAYALHAACDRTPGFYDFSTTRDHFTYENITDGGYPITGCLDFDFSEGGALCSPCFLRKKGELSRLILDAEISGDEGKTDIPVEIILSLYDGCSHVREYVYPTQTFADTIPAKGKRGQILLHLPNIDGDAMDFKLRFGAHGHAKIYSITLQ